MIVAECSEEGEKHLQRSLGPVQLTALGVGAVIGAGIFVMSGLGAHYAGPSLMLSFVFSGLGCAFAALCYAEFAAMIPLAGSAYTYAYATLGEIFAWIIGWDLTLEYAMGASTVSSGWSNNFVEFLKIFGIHLPLWMSYDHWTGLDTAEKMVARQDVIQAHPGIIPGSPEFVGALDKLLSTPSADLVTRAHTLLGAPHIFGIDIGFNLPAFLIALVITTILVIGIQESAKFNSAIVFIKVTVVLFIIGLGIAYIHPDYWGHTWTTFAPFGFAGISAAAGYIFFAYIGFDAISTTAQESRNPQRDLPIGIILSLLICTVLYVSVAGVLTGMVPWKLVNVEAPLTHAFLDHNVAWAGNIVTCGALAGLTSDGLLPRKFFADIHPRFHTPWKNTILVGCLAAVVGSVTPIDNIGKMVNIGTLLAFVMVCVSIVVLRFTAPDQPRPFRTPGIYFGGKLPIVPALGVAFNLTMMISLGRANWIRLVVWLVIGMFVYFFYSIKHSKVQALPDSTAGM